MLCSHRTEMREKAVFLISPQRQVGHRKEKISCRRSSRAETQRNSFFKPVDTSRNTGFHHRYHRPDSFSVILCASARDLFHSDPGKEVSGVLQQPFLLVSGFATLRPPERATHVIL